MRAQLCSAQASSQALQQEVSRLQACNSGLEVGAVTRGQQAAALERQLAELRAGTEAQVRRLEQEAELLKVGGWLCASCILHACNYLGGPPSTQLTPTPTPPILPTATLACRPACRRPMPQLRSSMLRRWMRRTCSKVRFPKRWARRSRCRCSTGSCSGSMLSWCMRTTASRIR